MNPILVENTRGGVVESFHRGSICIVNKEGEIVYSRGNTAQISFPRSALKFFQHIPLLISGAFDNFGFSDEDLALMCGSHNGESMHVEKVEHMLTKLKLSLKQLQCGAQQPTHKRDFIKLIRANEEPTSLHNNCSGKHSGFLAYCKFNNLTLEDYLSPTHPLHQEIKRITALFYEIPEEELVLGVDGCSAPIFGMPLYNQAIAYKNLICPEKFKNSELTNACNRIVKAVTTFPLMVAGTKRYCTDLMAVTKGRIIGKTGADGVYSLAIPEKEWGIAIKIDDGKMGPQYQVAHQLLKELDLISSSEIVQLEKYGNSSLVNFAGKEVGDTHAVVLNFKN